MGNYYSMYIFLCCKSVMYKSGSSILLYIEEKQTFMTWKLLTWNCKAVVLEDLQGAQRLLSKESRMASSHQLLQKWNFASHL